MSFIRNAPGIEGSIESIDTNALDPADIARIWKVYTTTKRRFLDPTAERLENYWWRIWGSRKRELNGATVARLFAQISDGHTFVPLRGPSNRGEETPPLGSNSRTGTSSATTLHRPTRSRPDTKLPSTISRTATPMPHPILKKSRGPSIAGPRPTARFISPPESERETEDNSSAGTNSHVIVQPPSPDPETTKNDKKSSGSAGVKKSSVFVASSAAKKKRPVIVRRQSSQSSTDSLHPAGSAQSPSQTAIEAQGRNKQSGSSRFQENFSPTSRSQAKPSAQKHRAATKAPDSKRKSRRNGSAERDRKLKSREVADHEQDEIEDLPSSDLEQIELQKTLLENSHSSKQPYWTGPQNTSNGRVNSQQPPDKLSSGKQHSESSTDPRILSHGGKGTTSLAPTFTSATGQLDLGDRIVDQPRSHSPSPSLASKAKGKGKEPEDSERAFTKRQVQATPAVSDPEGSLSRSKSQLTLLLEKDRGKKADR